MSGIYRRTIFTSRLPVTAGEMKGQSVYRFTDWAMCVTSQGSCFEPFIINDMMDMGHAMPTNFDPLDMIRRVDDIQSHDPSGETNLVSDQGTVLHRHNHWIRNVT
jgi:hypothetical protein